MCVAKNEAPLFDSGASQHYSCGVWAIPGPGFRRLACFSFCNEPQNSCPSEEDVAIAEK
jgi:hypothetical protein